MSSNLKPLTLHAHGTGPNPYKVAILLEALNLPYTVKLWQFGDAANGVKGTTFTKINPNGRVPALQDPNTGVTSWESLACMNYLLRVYDKSSTYGPPSDSEQGKADFDAWTSLLVSTVGPMMGQVNWFKHYNSEKNANALERYEAQAYRCFGVLEEQLKGNGGKYILGGQGPSAVDFHYEPWLKQYEFAGLKMDGYPSVKKWLEGVQGLEEVKKAYEKVGSGEEVKA